MSTQIRLAGVTKRFRSRAALSLVSAEIGHGVTGVLGPNGAGKTTLLRLVATALQPDTGELDILGYDPAAADGRLAIRRRLGYLPQDVGMYSGFTVREFVDYVAILKEITDRNERRAETDRVLDEVGLGDRAGQRIRSLSGGMRRRVGLAQALLGNPALLVLDEPTVGLDPVLRLQFRELVSRYATTGTVLLSTHLTEDVAAFCQTVLVIEGGQLIFAGTPAALTSMADGRVWTSAGPDAGSELSWRGADGRYRHIGDPPPDAELLSATLEDAYLLTIRSLPAQAVRR